MRRSGEDGDREQPIENYGKKEQKEWLDNILSDPHPCTAGNKEEEHTIHSYIKYTSKSFVFFSSNPN